MSFRALLGYGAPQDPKKDAEALEVKKELTEAESRQQAAKQKQQSIQAMLAAQQAEMEKLKNDKATAKPAPVEVGTAAVLSMETINKAKAADVAAKQAEMLKHIQSVQPSATPAADDRTPTFGLNYAPDFTKQPAPQNNLHKNAFVNGERVPVMVQSISQADADVLSRLKGQKRAKFLADIGLADKTDEQKVEHTNSPRSPRG